MLFLRLWSAWLCAIVPRRYEDGYPGVLICVWMWRSNLLSSGVRFMNVAFLVIPSFSKSVEQFVSHRTCMKLIVSASALAVIYALANRGRLL